MKTTVSSFEVAAMIAVTILTSLRNHDHDNAVREADTEASRRERSGA
jgi:hypothetical protein